MPTLLERAQKHGNPVIENGEAVFVWQGKQAPLLLGDFNGWDHKQPLAMTEAEPGVWTGRLPLPPDAYIEYGFFTSAEPDGRLRDPLSRHRKRNGMGNYNHWFGMPKWKPAPETKRKRGVPVGTLSEHLFKEDSGALAGGQRTVWLYQPPTGKPVPLLVVWDGRDYLKRGNLAVIVDNLIAQRRIQPIALIMPDNGGRWQARLVEYHTSEATVAEVEHGLLPYARAHLNLMDEKAHPGVHGVLGASMGGLMALTTGFMLPHIFGHVISQAGMYASWTSHGRPLLFDALQGSQTPLPRIWLDCGTFDSLLGGNHQILELLRAKGADVIYREYHTGHNPTAWANSVVEALEVMFPKES